jgi:seryl-tRNA synthetase
MIDPAWLRSDPDGLADSFRRRGLAVDVAGLVAMDAERRRARVAAEELRAEQNRAGKEIARLKGPDKDGAIAAVAALAERYRVALAEADEKDALFEAAWTPLPNPPHASVPVGRGEADNVEIRRWGDPRSFGFEPLDHVDRGERLGIIDMDRAWRKSPARIAATIP